MSCCCGPESGSAGEGAAAKLAVDVELLNLVSVSCGGAKAEQLLVDEDRVIGQQPTLLSGEMVSQDKDIEACTTTENDIRKDLYLQSEVAPQEIGARLADVSATALPGSNSDEADTVEAEEAGRNGQAPRPGDENGNGDGQMESVAMQLAGFGQPLGSSLSREDLEENGISGPAADAILVRAHEDEILLAHFQRWIIIFSLVMVFSLATMGVMIIAMAVLLSIRWEPACDVPLQDWACVTISIAVFNVTINRPGTRGSLIARCCCCWIPDPESPEPTPWRVRIYNALVTLFIFVWNCLGLHWSRVSGQQEDNDLPACSEVSGDLVLLVRTYAAFHLAFTVFMRLGLLGVAWLFRAAMRLGLVHTSNAAPKESLEKGTDVIEYTEEEEIFEQHPACSICLEDFKESTIEIRKTKLCNHVFHTQCLQGWLNMNRTCPLCREDLAVPEDADGPIRSRSLASEAQTQTDDAGGSSAAGAASEPGAEGSGNVVGSPGANSTSSSGAAGHISLDVSTPEGNRGAVASSSSSSAPPNTEAASSAIGASASSIAAILPASPAALDNEGSELVSVEPLSPVATTREHEADLAVRPIGLATSLPAVAPARMPTPSALLETDAPPV
eukprot:TRINITY_DN49086_c0_g1_i1.p1 TRINITY_DN49086_c0_g1~~TRINITY_DN49086_c0_g1_i1.p1  ORF type:complete len:635 (+),score=108.81 TRINITY_DN49086_c0_g1_i1:62-1906(+)